MGKSGSNYEFVLEFTSKKDGDLKDKHIKEQICSILKIKDFAYMKQVHSNIVKIVNAGGVYEDCDGLITNKTNLALFALSADCTPVLIKDEQNQVIAAVHAGRDGAFKNILQECINLMRKNFNSKPEHLKVKLGANIKQCCYEIDGEVLEYAKKEYKEFVKGKFLDIDGILKMQLLNLGIKNIEISPICTKCNNDYFSYRRNKEPKRQGGIIAMREKDGKY